MASSDTLLCIVLQGRLFACYRLCKGRQKARQKKMHQIARLLELPTNSQTSPSPPTYNLQALRLQESKSFSLIAWQEYDRVFIVGAGRGAVPGVSHRPLFTANSRVPGFAAAMRREEGARSSRTPSPASRPSAPDVQGE